MINNTILTSERKVRKNPFLQIIIASSPKMGNNWLSLLVATIYRIPQIPIRPSVNQEDRSKWALIPTNIEIPPRNFVGHEHLYPNETLIRLLLEAEVKVVTMLRHPADAFVSLYYYVNREPNLPKIKSNRYLIGKDIDDENIYTYLEKYFYDTIIRRSLSWLETGIAIPVRYEDLKFNIKRTLTELTEKLCPIPNQRINEAIAFCTIENMRTLTEGLKRLCRKGTVGEWKTVLNERHIELMRNYRDEIAKMGYSIEYPKNYVGGINATTNKLYISHGGRHYEINELNSVIDINNTNSAHSLLVSQVDHNSLVLDVGCSYGYLGKWLVENKKATVYGIEIDRIAVNKARSEGFYRDIFQIDLDYCEKIPGEFERFNKLDIQFDYIICADVLEHLKDPTTTLTILLEKLKDGGKLLISIPNIANIDVILNLINGKFNYSPVGILDSTHLRFFTKSSFIEWIQSINCNILKDYRLDIALIGSTKTLSDFANCVQTAYPRTYKLLTNAMGEEAYILQYVFVLTKDKRQPEDNSGKKSFEKNLSHIEAIEEQLNELSCASRIFKKKQEVSSSLKKLIALEAKLANLERKLTEKDSILQKILSRAYRITPMRIKARPLVITDKISVIIPVKNGGDKLRELLSKIRSQRKVQDVEIIVMDSESTDNSIQIAKEFGGKVIHIPQEEFNHGRTRNLGAAETNGNYLVFTVQDAMPVSDYWLYNMICPFIEYPNLAALSSKQFVKPKANLFSLWMNEALAKSYGLEGDLLYSRSEDPEEIDLKFFDSRTKRKLTFFDNVSSCIRRNIFKEIQFSPLMYAEDMDYGVKLFEKGKVLGYLTSTGVYHWHERGADYVFKRHYIGTKANVYILKNDLPCFFDMNNINWECLAGNIRDIYNLINISIAELGTINPEPVMAIKSFINALQRNIDAYPERIKSTLKEKKICGDVGLDLLLKQIIGDTAFTAKRLYNFKQNFLIPDFMNRFRRFAEYLYHKNQTLKSREKDFVSCIYKIFAMTGGESLGAYYIEQESLNRLTPDLKRIDRLLARGICY